MEDLEFKQEIKTETMEDEIVVKREPIGDEIVVKVKIEDNERVVVKEERDEADEHRRELFGLDLYKHLYELELGPLEGVPKVELVPGGEAIEGPGRGEGECGIESGVFKSGQRRLESEAGLENEGGVESEERVKSEGGVGNEGVVKIEGAGENNEREVQNNEGVGNEEEVENEGGVASALQTEVKPEPVEDDDDDQTLTNICVCVKAEGDPQCGENGVSHKSLPQVMGERWCQSVVERARAECLDIDHTPTVILERLSPAVVQKHNNKDHDPSSKGSGDSSKKYTCDKCEFGTNWKECLNRHYAARHSDKGTLLICDICSKEFARSYMLRRHKKFVHTDERPFSCQYCRKKFKTQDHLDRHLMTHMGEKNYICDVCQKTFTQRGNLTKHRRVHTGEKPYHCYACEYKTSDSSCLSSHMKTHDPVRERPFKCDQCEKTFLTKQVCDRHTQTHNPAREKPYKCNVCDFSTSLRGSLRDHLLIHSDVKPFSCDVCGFKTCSKFFLNSHKKKHIKGE